MFCPECGAEYRPEIAACAECRVPLVEALPENPRPEPVDTVPVFRTTSVTLLPVVTSLLDSAGIYFFVQGAEAMGVLPLGAMGSHVSRASLGAIVHVAEQDADSVRELLTDLDPAGVISAHDAEGAPLGD